MKFQITIYWKIKRYNVSIKKIHKYYIILYIILTFKFKIYIINKIIISNYYKQYFFIYKLIIYFKI